MREETRKKLQYALWRDRLKKIGLVVVGIAVVGGFFLIENLDMMVENHRVAGVIDRIGPVTSKSMKVVRDDLDVGVRLTDGRHVEVVTLKKNDPHVGDKVEVTEHIHATGRRTFTWR
jgi:hypothetical protein